MNNIHESRIIRPGDDYFINCLDRLFERGASVFAMNPEFDLYEVSQADRIRYILASEYSQNEEVKGTAELFGHRT